MKTLEFETNKGKFVLVDNPILPMSLSVTSKYIKLSEITEEQASEVIGYEISKVAKYNKLQLHSLIESNGIDINIGNWYLFKKI